MSKLYELLQCPKCGAASFTVWLHNGSGDRTLSCVGCEQEGTLDSLIINARHSFVRNTEDYSDPYCAQCDLPRANAIHS